MTIEFFEAQLEQNRQRMRELERRRLLSNALAPGRTDPALEDEIDRIAGRIQSLEFALALRRGENPSEEEFVWAGLPEPAATVH